MIKVLFILASLAWSAPESEPVAVGSHGNAELDACLSFGRVTVPGGKSVEMRAAPNASSGVVVVLEDGDLVHLCSVSTDGNWHGVIDGSDLNINCDIGSPVVEERGYVGACKSGWVDVKFIEVVAG